MDLELPPHPGRTVAEEKAIDFVLMGRPPGPPGVVRKLVADGLVLLHLGWRRDIFGAYEVPRYSLPDGIRRRVEDYYLAREEEGEAP